MPSLVSTGSITIIDVNDGSTFYTASIYVQSTTQPATPTGGSYNFSTKTLVEPTGAVTWLTSLPTTTSNPTWVCTYTFSTNTPLITEIAGTWSVPKIFVKNGNNGIDGARGASKFYATGSSWVDATALAAVLARFPSGIVVQDEVTISNGTTFAMTKYWNGSAWVAPGTVIDGSLLVTNSVSAAKVNTNGLTIRDSSGNIILDAGGSTNNIDFSKIFGATKPENNATVGANGSNLIISTSGNILPNSDFASGIQNWVVTWIAGGGTNYQLTWDLATSYWAPAGGHTIGVVRNGTTQAASSWFDITYDKYFPMQAGISFELSAYLAAHRCGVEIRIAYYTSAQVYISETGWGTSTPPSGGNDLNNWARLGGIATTPANTAYVRIWVRGSGVDAGQSEPYFWATKIFFGLTKPGQTQLSPWSAATSSGAFAELSQITGSNSVTYIANAAIKNALIENISADKITTGTLSASTNLTVGTAVRSGTTMTGAGAVFEGTGGYFSLGNSTKNITFDGSAFYMNGPVVKTSNIEDGSVSNLYDNGGTVTAVNIPTTSGNIINFQINPDAIPFGQYNAVLSCRVTIFIDDIATNTVANNVQLYLDVYVAGGFVKTTPAAYLLLPPNATNRTLPIGSMVLEFSVPVNYGQAVQVYVKGRCETASKLAISSYWYQTMLFKK